MATITGLYTDVGLKPLNGRAPRLRFQLEGGPALSTIGGRVVSQAPVIVEPDARGYFVADVIGNDQLQGKTSYRLIAEYLGENGSIAESIDVLTGLVVTGVGGAITDMLPSVPPLPPFPTDQLLASHVATIEAGLTRVARNSDLAGSLTPDGRTKVVLLSGQPDQVYTNFTGGWTTDAQSSDLSRVKAGVASRRLLVPSAGTFTCRWTEAKTFPPASLLQAWVWIDDPSKITSIGFRPCVSWTRADTGPFQPGWNLIRFRASEGVLTNWGTVDYVQLTVIATGAVGINIGQVWVECPPKAQICFIEDRGYKTFKDFGVPNLRALGIPIVWALDPAINGSNPGTTAEAITDADVALFYSQGDDMTIHAYDGAVTSTMTPQQIREDTLKSLAWLQERGYTRGRQIRGAWTQNLAPNHAAAQPYWGAYATPANNSANLETWPPKDKFNIGRYTLHGRTNAQLDTMFDQMQKTNQILFAYTHGIDDTLSGAISHATWDYFIAKCTAAINAGWLEGVTFSQLLARSGGIIR